MAQAYLLFGANGKIMQPIEQTSLPLGQVVSYGDMANPQQEAVVIEETGGLHGQACIFVEDFHKSHVSQTYIDGPGGWRKEDRIASQEEIDQLKTAHVAKQKADSEAHQQKEAERQTLLEKGRALYEKRPAWAKAAILARMEEDASDSQSDYFNSRTVKRLFLGWSRHDKDRFDEMRKAAATRPETSHLGPGKDVWKILVYTEPEKDENHYRNSHYLFDCPPLTTEEEARNYAEQLKAEDEQYMKEHGFCCPKIPHGYKLVKHSIEERQKYSMGRGYFLATAMHSGWQVYKHSLSYDADTIMLALAVTPDLPEPEQVEESTVEGESVAVTLNKEKNGVEVRFAQKPQASVLDQLKSNGFRWSKFQGLWYARQSEKTIALARSLAE